MQTPWLHRYATLVAVCTLFLVVAGASVTSKEAGLSVPDWPLSYGQVIPEMTGGVLFETGHRMIATVVGALNVRDGGRWRRVRAARDLDVASLRDRRPLWPGARFRSSDGRHLPEKEPTGRVCGGGAGLVAGPGTNWSASIRELAGGLKAATGTAVPSASRGSAMFARSSRSASTAPVPLARRCPRRDAGLTGPGTVRY